MKPMLLCLLMFLVGCDFGTPATPLTAAAAIDLLKGQGLPISEITTYTADTDPNHLAGRPMTYTSMATFQDTRLPPAPVQIEVYATAKEAQDRYALVYAAYTQGHIADHVLQHGRVVVFLREAFAPPLVAEYTRALAALP